MAEGVVISQSQFGELMTKVALIQQDTAFMREEARTQRESIAELQSQVQTIQVERATEKALVKGRAQMAKWVWGGAVSVSGLAGGCITLLLNAYLKIGSHP